MEMIPSPEGPEWIAWWGKTERIYCGAVVEVMGCWAALVRICCVVELAMIPWWAEQGLIGCVVIKGMTR